MWVGIDDTDSPKGGCTTWMMTELVRLARASKVDLIGCPRLVRLNPNIPWKTRGNAALAARFGHGVGRPRMIGEIGRSPVLAFPRGSALSAVERRSLADRFWSQLQVASSTDPATGPALVASPHRLPSTLYRAAVQEVVGVRENVRHLRKSVEVARSRRGQRGLVGAAAAIAWPARRVTWELIAYRRPGRIGSPRSVDPHSVERVEEREPDLFLCTDPRTRRLLVTPHSRCPILFGLRGTTPDAPLRARRSVRSEPVDRWMLFETNQGTGDHLAGRRAGQIGPYRSAVVRGWVSRRPRARTGGHVEFELRDEDGDRIRCFAFEPTKTLPRIAQRLLVGDRIRVWGSRGRAPGLRLEGIRVERLATSVRRSKPPCPRCGGPTRSLGRERGFRCASCGVRLPPERALVVPATRDLRLGTYHPTASARRHLAPLATAGAASPEPF